MSRILIVEDEQHLAGGLRFNLEAEGYTVDVAETGEAGLELVLASSPPIDVVVLDVMLPGIDGFTVVSEMRRAGHFIPTLMLTARGHADDVLKHALTRRPEAIDKLRAGIEIYGVRVYGELKLRMMYDNPDALRMYRYCGKMGLPVTVHIDYEFDTGRKYPRPNYWYGGGIEAFERAVKACPETSFLGHAPGFWAHISGDGQFDKAAYPQGKVMPGGKVVEMLRACPNLYCDLSAGSGCNALKRDPEHAREFLLEFQDRVCYGRDYFDNEHQAFLNSLGLPEEALTKIYSGNALRLVPL